jgi:branched-chain amino acid transport system ATP-binding protein
MNCNDSILGVLGITNMSILECTDIIKDFGGLRALNGISLSIGEKEIVGLIGPNGAGKTTLFNVAAGLYKPTSGEVKLGNRIITGLPSHRICKFGIARTFQQPQPFVGLTVLQNVLIGHYFGKTGRAKLTVLEILDYLGLMGQKDEFVENLTIVGQKKVEIAKALATNPSLLMLDEVASGLNPGEQDDMIKLIQKLHKELDITLIVVEHIMRFVMTIANRIVVLDNGKIIKVGDAKSVSKDEQVIKAYLGEEYIGPSRN